MSIWFKQVRVYDLPLPQPFDLEKFEAQLAAYNYSPCLPSLPSCHGWVPPIGDQDAPLIHAVNGNIWFCLQFEEKILPATIVRQAVADKVKVIEAEEDRRVYQKEKRQLREEATQTLLSRAFSKLSRVNAYIDTQYQRLVIDSTVASKLESFIGLLKKSYPHLSCQAVPIKKLLPLLTSWVVDGNAPGNFTIENAGVLMDPNDRNRIVRCQKQDLMASGIQSLIKEGCQVQQLALNWQEQLQFTLNDEFALRGFKYGEEVLNLAKDDYSETEAQRADTDFVIMASTLNECIDELCQLLRKPGEAPQEKNAVEAGIEAGVMTPAV